MTVTMYNKATKTTVTGIHIAYSKQWIDMGFEIIAYESNKVVLLQKAS